MFGVLASERLCLIFDSYASVFVLPKAVSNSSRKYGLLLFPISWRKVKPLIVSWGSSLSLLYFVLPKEERCYGVWLSVLADIKCLLTCARILVRLNTYWQSKKRRLPPNPLLWDLEMLKLLSRSRSGHPCRPRMMFTFHGYQNC